MVLVPTKLMFQAVTRQEGSTLTFVVYAIVVYNVAIT